MKFTLSLALIFLLRISHSLPLHAQKKKEIISLETNQLPGDYEYFCDSIIDKRIVRDNIGFAQVGMNNRNIPVVFEDDFIPYLKAAFDVMIPKSENPGLVFIIHELNVSELTKATKEFGFCNVAIEFAIKKDGKLFSLGSFYSQKEDRAMDVTRRHAERIKSALVECVYNFNQSDWKNIVGEEIKPEPESFELTLKEAPPKGFYESFHQIIEGKPFSDESFILKNNQAKKFTKYYPFDKNDKRIKRRLMAFSDGKNLYINAALYGSYNHFVKALEYGKLTIFEDVYVDPMAMFAFGATGAIVSTKKRAIVLDSHTGLLSMLDRDKLNDLLENYPGIKKEFNDSKKKLKDVKVALSKINAEHLGL